MELAEFWTLIEDAHRFSSGNADDQAERLVETLSARPVADVISFGQWFNTMMARAYYNAMMAAFFLVTDGCHSDDGFEYFRAWLIGQGQASFEAVVGDPDALATKLTDGTDPGSSTDGESLVYVAVRAAKAILGEDALDEDPALDDALSETSPDPSDGDGVDDPRIADSEAAKRLPQLAARLESIWERDPERPSNLTAFPQPDGSTVYSYPHTGRVAFALGPNGLPIRGVGDVT